MHMLKGNLVYKIILLLFLCITNINAIEKGAIVASEEIVNNINNNIKTNYNLINYSKIYDHPTNNNKIIFIENIQYNNIEHNVLNYIESEYSEYLECWVNIETYKYLINYEE